MSSTKRGGKRSPADFYATPPWVTHRLLDGVLLPGGRWLEPCAGDGELIRAINEKRLDIAWSANELREEMRPCFSELLKEDVRIGDYLEVPENEWGPEPFDVIVTNPPFSLALPIIKKSLRMAKKTVMLLRLNFWGSEERQSFMAAFPPDTYVLPNRPVFTVNKEGKPGTDSPEYAWFVWESQEWYEKNPYAVEAGGKIKILPVTPKTERKVWTDHIKKMSTAVECSENELPPDSSP